MLEITHYAASALSLSFVKTTVPLILHILMLISPSSGRWSAFGMLHTVNTCCKTWCADQYRSKKVPRPVQSSCGPVENRTKNWRVQTLVFILYLTESGWCLGVYRLRSDQV